MKKTLKIILNTLCIAMVIQPITNVSAVEEDSKITEVKEVVQEYFDSEFESIKNGHALNTNNIICNDKFKKFIDLKHERQSLWYKGLNDVILNYCNKIDYDSINFDNDNCKVNLKKNVSFSFERTPDIVSEEFGVEHELDLKCINGKWFIDNDINKEEQKDEISYAIKNEKKVNGLAYNTNDNEDTKINYDKKIKDLEEDISNLDEEIKEFKDYKNLIKNEKRLRGYGRRTVSYQHEYDYKAAVNYAHRWAYSRNPNYPKYDSDCANFVSQCIYAGAPVMNMGATWYCGKMIVGNAWLLVEKQWDFLTKNNGSGPVANDNTRYHDICCGDVINFWSTGYSCYHHTVIVTLLGEFGEVFFSGHTTDRKNYSLDAAYSAGGYDISKQRTAHMFGYND